jgi:hypothetical protein
VAAQQELPFERRAVECAAAQNSGPRRGSGLRHGADLTSVVKVALGDLIRKGRISLLFSMP